MHDLWRECLLDFSPVIDMVCVGEIFQVADYDIAVMGGGLNGVSLARDAAGRGLRVIVLEKGDLGAGASATSSPLIQGDLRALARGRFGCVRRALDERDVWQRLAPHLVHQVRVVVPMDGEVRPPWAWRFGLGIQDHLAARAGPWPGSETIDLTHHALGDPLKRPFGLAVGYWAGLADSARLTVLTALDAADRGATIVTGARCVRADRSDIWRIVAISRGQRQVVSARALVNATGGWLASVAETVLRLRPPPVKLVQSSQIVVHRLFDHASVYLLQNPDRQLLQVVPLTGDVTLVGAVQREFAGDPAHAAVSAPDASYLTRAVSRYFREQIEPSDIIRSVCGIHVVTAGLDKTGAPDEGQVLLERRYGEAPLLTTFGGETTTARRQAEAGMAKLAPFFSMPGPWTARAPLPGGNLAGMEVDGLVHGVEERYPFLTPGLSRRLVNAYGTLAEKILDGVRGPDDLGPDFGEGLSGREVTYLMTREWARFADDVLWRRSSLGFTMSGPHREALAQFMTMRDQRGTLAGEPSTATHCGRS